MFRVLPPVGGMIPYRAVLDSLQVAMGTAGRNQDLRRQFADWTDLTHWVLTNSGRSALSVVLMGLRKLHPNRDEVVIPAYTSYSVPAAVVRAGLRVRLCDVETETLGLSPKELERVLNARTLCVVPNHLFGVPCQIQALCEIARDRGVPVVEDAAQAMGVKCLGRPIGAFGDAAIFSLSRGKTLPAAGGGLIGTNDEALADHCRLVLAEIQPALGRTRQLGLRSAFETALMAMFIRPSLYWLPAALPFLKLGASIYDPTFPVRPMSRFQEALGARLLPGLKELRNVRQANTRRLRQALEEIQGLYVIWPKEGDEGGFLRLPVLVRDSTARRRALSELDRRGLGATCGYPLPLSEVSDLKPHIANLNDNFQVAKLVARQLVTLPTHAWVTDCDIEQTAEVFARCVR